MLYVEVAIDAGNLPRELSQMRTWLDHMKFQAIGFSKFRAQISTGSILKVNKRRERLPRRLPVRYSTALPCNAGL